MEHSSAREVHHPLTDALRAAAAGLFPSEDGSVRVVRPLPTGSIEWVVSFTAHVIIATAKSPQTVRDRGADAYGGALTPAFLGWLAGEDGWVGCQDAVLVAHGEESAGLARREDLDDHPRVQHARRLRSEVGVYGNDRGFVTLGAGLGGLPEISIEVTAGQGGRGYGRALLRQARSLVDPADTLVAQVTPGNARSLRAFLAAGFVPVGSAVAIVPGRGPLPGSR